MPASAARTRRTLLVLLGGLAVIAGAAWYMYAQLNPAYVPAPPFTRHRVLSTFTENGVHVEIALEQDANGTLVLAGTYTPTDAHEHLYSTDLPAGGLNGAGRPTLLELPKQAGVAGIGKLLADQPVILDPFPTINTTFPIYPDGAVTLRLPITIAAPDTQIRVSVTYMACSSTGFCLPPVENKQITLDVAGLGHRWLPDRAIIIGFIAR
jgi:hypothetical protein